MAKSIKRKSFVAAVFVAALALKAGAALAHSVLASSVPADGSTLAAAPEEVVLAFSEEVTPVSCRLLGADGGEVAAIDAVRKDGVMLHVPLPAGLGAGVYKIVFRVVGGDAHAVNGEMSFTVAAP